MHHCIVETALCKIITCDTDTDDEIIAAPFTDALNDPYPETQTIRERAAVRIGALVRVLRPELIDKVAVARIHFAAVKVALLQSPRCIGKGLDELRYRFLVECVRGFAVVRLADRRWSIHPMQPVYAPPPSVRDV